MSRTPLRNPGPYLDWDCVSVVVVVTGAGTVVCCEVEVVLCVLLGSVEHADNDTRATVARQTMISLFISIIFWFVDLQAHHYAIGSSSAIRCNPTLRQTPEAGAGKHVEG